ncbi:methylaspartate mutase sigma subunit [Cytobacillus horneckiae]|uniref:Methylaspartate mutase subunit S n=1 Tax=Cytobacillus horneckiae TaxID=549687 RepID=A0A2N0ZGA7_9BACI|nr:methylaspartate mutase subunit S [Cytobacillus horneckiae]NRG47529.1 methylaspartate mutase subunit S [Bacillus sp. CRN 9]MBN6886072.1 methylaspartate mutase subunit S [Cytobacillus horneckiae]MCM3176376.1 methylaspartate mutase subunit S [Cytobacillus horneckiae]MEC1155790.1 methylaspartate mutase subunit S [Cytobacillus horneckiae]MED2939329.1 methylaspartate mutase subunit S [Cytobacillus horneckiae]
MNTDNTIVMGVIGQDCHSVGNKVLHFAFKEKGFVVHNLGVQCSQEDLIKAAKEVNADAIVVSSLYGHAELDCRGFSTNCIKNGLNNVLLYIGGNLSIGKSEWEVIERKFLKMGFNRVFSASDDLEWAIDSIYNDISLRKFKHPVSVTENKDASQKRKVN